MSIALAHADRAHAPAYQLHRDLLHLRRSDPALKQRRSDMMHGAVLAERALALRIFCETGDRLLITDSRPRPRVAVAG